MIRAVAFFRVSLVLLVLVAQTPRIGARGDRARPGPSQLILWAWERPEDLRHLPPDVSVAFLSQTINISRDRVEFVPRRQPLRVAAATPMTAVTRIEAAPGAIAKLNPAHVSAVADAIARTARLPRVQGLQIDFDARASEQAAYRALLLAVRQRIGAMPLAITPLASWCVGDRWIDTLPVDEAIPMLFRMGPINEPYREAAQQSGWTSARCRGSLGASVDEPASLRFQAKRVYVFNPRPWRDEVIDVVRARYRP